MCISLIVVMISGVYTYVQPYEVVQFIVCQLCLNKADNNNYPLTLPPPHTLGSHLSLELALSFTSCSVLQLGWLRLSRVDRTAAYSVLDTAHHFTLSFASPSQAGPV